MKKITVPSIFLVYIVLLEVFGCNTLPSTVQSLPPTPSPVYSPTVPPSFPLTLTSPFFHYTSDTRSNIYLEFDFPSTWGFGEDIQNNRIRIALYEPRYFTVPTEAVPDENHPPLNDFGVIDIRVRPQQSDESFDEYVQKFAKDENYDHKIILDKYSTQVAGVNAVVIEAKLDKNYLEIHLEEMFLRDIFFTVDNFIYQIRLTISMKDRGNEFEKGYEYFIGSLRAMP